MTTTTDDGWTGRALLPHEECQLRALALVWLTANFSDDPDVWEADGRTPEYMTKWALGGWAEEAIDEMIDPEHPAAKFGMPQRVPGAVTLPCGSVVKMGDDRVPLVVVEAES